MGEEGKQIIYTMSRVSKIYQQKKVLKDVSLSYFYGAKIGVLGLNGSGKSTLLKIMAGIDEDYLGEAVLSRGYSIGYLEQEPQLNPEKTVKEVVQEGVQNIVDLLKEFDDISAKFSEDLTEDQMNNLLAKQAKLQDRLDAADAWSLDNRLELAMNALCCPPPDQKCATLSGGEKRRVALCRLLLKEPDILLLDEPTNHLDAETVLWLERHLKDYKGTIIAVTHDRYFLDNVAGWILELDRGEGIPFKGNYTAWLEQKTKRLEVEEKRESKRQKYLKEELQWIKSSPKARHAKSKSRVKDYQDRLKQSKEKYTETNEIFIPSGDRLGDVVINVEGLSKSYGDKLLYDKLSFKLPPGGIVGVIGPNGAGKTTLFKMLVGEEKPDNGAIEIGKTVKLSYIGQDRDLDPDKTVYQVISSGNDVLKIGGRDVNSRAYTNRFNFSGEDQKKKVDELSGGERNRVHLACLLKQEGNLLLLDEPTNDLDVNTLQALEKALIDFPGCAVIISHDRYFLDRISTHILSFEEDIAQWFDGNFSEYLEDRKRRIGEDFLINRKSAHKKIKRN